MIGIVLACGFVEFEVANPQQTDVAGIGFFQRVSCDLSGDSRPSSPHPGRRCDRFNMCLYVRGRCRDIRSCIPS